MHKKINKSGKIEQHLFCWMNYRAFDQEGPWKNVTKFVKICPFCQSKNHPVILKENFRIGVTISLLISERNNT